MLCLGIMSRQKQNLLWLMIFCCASLQITCSKIMMIGDNLTDAYVWNVDRSTCAAVNVPCQSAYETLIGDFCIVSVQPNSTSMGQCKTSNKTHVFNITNNNGEYKVRVKVDFQNITLWFLPHEAKCLSSAALKLPDHNVTCQTTTTPTTQTPTTQTPTTQTPTTQTSTTQTPTTESSTTCAPNNKGPNTDCLGNRSVDPGKICANLTTNGDKCCSGNQGNTYVLNFNGTKWMCVLCVEILTILPPHEMTLVENDTTNGTIDPSKASQMLEKMDSLVAKMEQNNKSNAAIVIGDIIGVIQRQAKNTESKDIKICYSSNQNLINVVEINQNTDFPWSVKIPSEAFNKSRLENNGSAFVGVLRFRNMNQKDELLLNNEVYGITMRANISNLTNIIEMSFTHKDLVGNASCSSWDGKGNLTWTTSGCETEKIDNNTIKCSCSHLTFFAVLMSPPGTNISVSDVKTLTFITSIGCGISMFFLSVALFMHFLLRKAKSNQATKILMNMFVALFLLNLSFLSNESVANTEDKSACVFIALLMHYSMLSTFTWFFIQALHMFLWLIRQNVTITNYMRKITVFGWTFPGPIVIAVISSGGYKLIIKSTSENTIKMCWITNNLIHYIVNIGYYALVFIFTTVIFIMIVTKIVQARHIKAPDGKKKTFRKQIMMVLSLFLLFGLTWAVAFFSYGPMLIPSLYIFTVLNSFQGFFLFLYYYHIHNDVAGNFSDDPERSSSSSSSTKTIVESTVNAVENLNN